MVFPSLNSMRHKMCGKNFACWCCTLFLLISSSSSKFQKNHMNNEGEDNNLIERYELEADSTTNYDDELKTLHYNLHERSTNDTQNDEHCINSTSNNCKDDNSGQYKFEKNFIQNHESDNNKMMELHANSTNFNIIKNFTSRPKRYRDLIKLKDNKNSTSYNKTFNKDDNKYNIVPYEMCDNITCIPLCCPLGNQLIDDECTPKKNEILPLFPNVYEYMNNSLQNGGKRIDELFYLVVHNLCQKSQRSYYLLDTKSIDHSDYKYIFLVNGSLYLPHNDTFVESTSYCLADMQQNKFDVIICSEALNNQDKNKKESKGEDINILYSSDEERSNLYKQYIFHVIVITLYIMSTLILLATFLVYSYLPELRNTHGFMLCMYSGFRIVESILDMANILFLLNRAKSSTCITMYIVFPGYFCALAGYFWLNAMSLDMWFTFKKLNFLVRSTKKQEKRKLIMYSIYAVGSPGMLTIICIIINISGVPEDFLWFIDCGKSGYMGYMLYFFLPKSICTVISVSLCILVAFKIRRYEKEATSHLRDSESQCYNENKKWFSMYLKLFVMVFIIIGIQWSMQMVYVLYHQHHQYKLYKDIVIYTLFLSDILISLGIFIIFVCKKRIMQLLLKRFGCQKYNLTAETRHDTDVTSSSTCNTSSRSMRMSENINPCRNINSHETDAIEL